jgi:O-antigen/teichoic acid export membrane protein
VANLLKKQGIYNSIILYVGTALGFFNLVILFQRFLTIEEIGFFSLMIAISLLYAQIASVGVTNIIIKYFPYYRTDDKSHGGFVTFVLIWCISGFALLTVFFFLFKNAIIAHYQQQKGARLLVAYYYFLIPVSFLTAIFALLESIAITVFKNVLSSFLREVFLRFFTMISILLIAASLVDYHEFLIIYIGVNVMMVLILLRSIISSRQFKLTRISRTVYADKIKMLKYGFFTVLSNSSFVLIQNLDIMMLTLIKKDLGVVGIYSTFFYIAVVISLPSKALNRTSLQIIAQSWAVNDLQKISKIYHKTSVVQMMVGCLLLVGMIVNRGIIILLLHKPEYAGYFNVFIVVGFAFLADITGGLNGYILNLSIYYRWTTFIIGSCVIFCVLSNWLLIPWIGIMGAAVAYLLAMILLNFVYWLFLKIKFNLQPFGKAHILIIFISFVAFFAGWIVPVFSGVWIDAIVRSAIVILVYVTLAYFLKVSGDINQEINKIIKSEKV